MSDDGLELADAVTEQQVEQFLRANPDFFCNRDELLSGLTIPHRRGDSISLVERQVNLLRERNHALRERLTDLLSIARDNDSLFERTRRLVLSIMEAQTLDAIMDAVDDSLNHDFHIEYVSLMLVADSNLTSRVPCYSPSAICDGVGVSSLLESNQVICGRLREMELAFLFPNHYKLVKSSAVVPLYHKRPLGILAVGSRKQNDFRAGTGTMFLSFIGEVISLAIESLVPARSYD